MSATDAGWLCICGCGQPAKTGSQYASDACRARRYDQKNPRVNKAAAEVLRRRLVETTIQPNDLAGYDPENPHVGIKAISREEAERRWPSKPHQELLRDHHASCPRSQAWDDPSVDCLCPPTWPRKVVYRPRRPRPPRIHIDVLGEDAELLDRLACEAGISRTAYVSYLIRRAGGRDVE